MKHGISAVLIAKNGSGTLKRCLDSLGGLDQIVVLDTGSTDGTMDIARSCGVDVFQDDCLYLPEGRARDVFGASKKYFHFANARNKALMKAKNKWVLTIDADEALQPGSLGPMLEAVRGTSLHGFVLGYENREVEGGSVMSNPRMILFRRDCWFWKYRVHERLIPVYSPARITSSPARIAPLPKCIVEHHPLPDKSGRRAQNLELLRICVEEDPEYLYAWRQLGMEYVLLEQWAQAIPHLEHYLNAPPDKNSAPFERAASRMHLAKCLARSGNLDQAMSEFNRAAGEAPKRREPRYWGAIELLHANRPWEAVEWFKMCLHIEPWDFPAFSLNSSRIQDNIVIEEDIAFCDAELKKMKEAWEAKNKSSV